MVFDWHTIKRKSTVKQKATRIFSWLFCLAYHKAKSGSQINKKPFSVAHHKAKSGSQINKKPLFCFMVDQRLDLSNFVNDFQEIKSLQNSYKGILRI